MNEICKSHKLKNTQRLESVKVQRGDCGKKRKALSNLYVLPLKAVTLVGRMRSLPTMHDVTLAASVRYILQQPQALEAAAGLDK